MHVLILGAAGMIGRKLTDRLVADASLGRRAIARLTLIDIVAPQVPAHAHFPITAEASDFTAPGAAERMLAGRPDVIFHLAAIVLARQRPISTRGCASISTAPVTCSMRFAARWRDTHRGSSSRPRSRCS